MPITISTALNECWRPPITNRGDFYGCERKFGIHIDTHAGLPRLLRERGDDAIADVFGGLGTIRQGWWYDGKGNGETISLVLEILDTIVRWSKRR